MANARAAIELVIEDRPSRGEPIPADVQPQLERITTSAKSRRPDQNSAGAAVEKRCNSS